MDMVGIVLLEAQVVGGILSLTGGCTCYLALLVLTQFGKDAVHDGPLLCLDAQQSCGVLGRKVIGKDGVVAGLFIERPAYRVV